MFAAEGPLVAPETIPVYVGPGGIQAPTDLIIDRSPDASVFAVVRAGVWRQPGEQAATSAGLIDLVDGGAYYQGSAGPLSHARYVALTRAVAGPTAACAGGEVATVELDVTVFDRFAGHVARVGPRAGGVRRRERRHRGAVDRGDELPEELAHQAHHGDRQGLRPAPQRQGRQVAGGARRAYARGAADLGDHRAEHHHHYAEDEDPERHPAREEQPAAVVLQRRVGPHHTERHELVERAQAAGISDIQGTLCRTEDRICPHFHSCRYQAQRKDLAARAHGVVVLPHAYLTLPVAFLQAPDVVVIDESHHTQFAGRIRLDLTDITDAATNWQKAGISKASDWSALSSRIVAAFKSERPILAALRTAGINAGMLEAGREYLTEVEDEMAAGILPDMDTAMIERRLQEFRASTLVKVKSLIRALIDEIDLPRDESNGVVVATIKGLIRAYVHFRLDPVVPDNAALLILDASEDPMITRAIWGEMPRQAVEIERRANVTQIIGRSMSKTSLTGHGKANALGDARPISEKTVIDAERLQADICRKVAELPGKVLAIGQKDVVAGLTFRRPKGKPPVMKAHFNALRGLDGFKDFDSVAVVGRLLPPVWAMEAVARSLWATDPAPIITQADYSDQTVALTTRDGAKATVTEPTHPDPRVAAVLRQSLKAEVLQALDRLRLIHATTEKTVLIINEVALPGLVVDRVEQFRQWRADGSRIERALKTLDVIPLTAGKMVEIAGHIWESERSAERDLKALNDALDNTANLQEDNIQLDFGGIISDTENVRFQLVRYRHPGQRGRDCRALVRLGTRDVPGTLAAFVGPLSAIDVPGAPAIVHEIDIPPHVGGDLAERIAVMVIDGGLSEAAALATIRQEARAMSP